MLRTALLLPAILVTCLGACATPAEEPPAEATTDVSTSVPVGFRLADIRSTDGTVLKANVIEPTTPGLHPAIALPSSWGLFDVEYVVQARKLAGAGYTVLSYTPRGFWASGGAIDTAGPKDVADAHAVIDWLVANTSADPEHIGMAGVSYGAGISLLAAAFDPRIKAVGSISGWSDLVASLYADETRRAQTVALLVLAAKAVGRTSSEFDRMIEDFVAYRNIDQVKSWGAVRSASTYLPELNRQRPAILMANAYGDSIFPADQLVDFYGALEGPKRLELRLGDHAVPEATGLVGLPNGVWDSLRRWMDTYLRGLDAQIPNGIELHSESGGGVEFSTEWAKVSQKTRRYGLGEIGLDLTGALGGAPTSDWTHTTSLSIDTVAYGGIALASGLLDALTGVPPLVDLYTVDRLHGAVWVGDADRVSLRGIPAVHLSFTANRPKGTLVSYLYDVDGLGVGRLITHAPASWHDVAPSLAGASRTLEARLPAVDYDVPEGHSLALVIDGHDPLYIDENDPGSAVTFAGPSWIDLPLR